MSVSSLDIAVGIGYLTVREVQGLKEIARLLPPHARCVNIGSGAGTSVIALLEERPDVYVHDIDLSLENGLPQLIETGWLENDHLMRIEGDSQIVGLKWGQGKIDWLFIDGDHSEAGIRGDYAAWLPHVTRGGYVLVHDYASYPSDHDLAGVQYWPEVPRVTDEVMSPFAVVMDIDRLRVFRMRERPL